jgi:crossover junction endodeoxyribonuclease RuvC
MSKDALVSYLRCHMQSRLIHSRVLGIDPGTNLLGYGLLEGEGNIPRILAFGTLNLTGFESHQEKLREIYLQLQDIIEAWLPGVLAIEAPFYGKNVQSMLKLGRAQGVAIAAGITMGMEIVEYSPKKVKQAVTGNGNAAKEQVSAMLTHLIGSQAEGTSYDASDALAVAFCHYQRMHAPGDFHPAGPRNWKAFLRDNPARIRDV